MVGGIHNPSSYCADPTHFCPNWEAYRSLSKIASPFVHRDHFTVEMQDHGSGHGWIASGPIEPIGGDKVHTIPVAARKELVVVLLYLVEPARRFGQCGKSTSRMSAPSKRQAADLSLVVRTWWCSSWVNAALSGIRTNFLAGGGHRANRRSRFNQIGQYIRMN